MKLEKLINEYVQQARDHLALYRTAKFEYTKLTALGNAHRCLNSAKSLKETLIRCGAF